MTSNALASASPSLPPAQNDNPPAAKPTPSPTPSKAAEPASAAPTAPSTTKAPQSDGFDASRAPATALSAPPAETPALPGKPVSATDFLRGVNTAPPSATQPPPPPAEAAPEACFTTPTPTVKQPTATDCGATVAASIGSANPDSTVGAAASLANMPGAPSDTVEVTTHQQIHEFDLRYGGADGTDPTEMAKMLAHVSCSVTNSSERFDHALVDQSLQKQEKVVALLDSSLLEPTAKPDAKAGAPHWVEIDGKDKQGHYLIKDPATGTLKPLSKDQLSAAVSSCWTRFKGGGVMSTSRAGFMPDEDTLSQQNAKLAKKLGDANGIGSNAKSFNIEG